MKQLPISVLLLLTCWTTYAQQNNPIDATNGTIDPYVGITWTLSDPVVDYEIIRSETNDPSKGNIIKCKPEGFCGDRKAVRGVKYYYWLKLYKASGEAILTPFDKGWRPNLPEPTDIAQVRYDAELYTSFTTVKLADSVVIAQPEISGKWQSNRIVGIKTVLRYIGGNQLNDVSLKVFISDDTLLDDEDELINEIDVDKSLNADITDFDATINLPKTNYKNKNLILAVIQEQEVMAITVKAFTKD